MFDYQRVLCLTSAWRVHEKFSMLTCWAHLCCGLRPRKLPSELTSSVSRLADGSVEASKPTKPTRSVRSFFFGVGTCRRPTWSLGGMNSCEGSWALGLRMFAVASRSSRHYQLDHVGSARIQSPTWDGFSWQSLGLRTTMCSISVSSSGVWDRSMLCVFFSEVTCEATHFLQLVVPVLSVLTHVFPSVCIFQFPSGPAAVRYMRLFEEFEPELRILSGKKTGPCSPSSVSSDIRYSFQNRVAQIDSQGRFL